MFVTLRRKLTFFNFITCEHVKRENCFICPHLSMRWKLELVIENKGKSEMEKWYWFGSLMQKFQNLSNSCHFLFLFLFLFFSFCFSSLLGVFSSVFSKFIRNEKKSPNEFGSNSEMESKSKSETDHKRRFCLSENLFSQFSPKFGLWNVIVINKIHKFFLFALFECILLVVD